MLVVAGMSALGGLTVMGTSLQWRKRTAALDGLTGIYTSLQCRVFGISALGGLTVMETSLQCRCLELIWTLSANAEPSWVLHLVVEVNK